jgi:hypothetical protein
MTNWGGVRVPGSSSPAYTDCEVTAMNKEQFGTIRGWMYVLGVWLCGSEVVAYYRRTSKRVLKP